MGQIATIARRVLFGAALPLIVAVGTPAVAQSGADSENFLTAIKEQDGATANSLVQGNPSLVNARGYSRETPLGIATRARAYDWMSFLLSRGARANDADASGDPPLILASRIGYGEGVALLLSRGARADEPNRKGETALIVAVQARRPAIVRALMEAGANPRRTDFVAGLSALDYARRDTRNPELVRLIETVKRKGAMSGPVR